MEHIWNKTTKWVFNIFRLPRNNNVKPTWKVGRILVQGENKMRQSELARD